VTDAAEALLAAEIMHAVHLSVSGPSFYSAFRFYKITSP
jgi:hypothetical protein